MHLYAEIEWSNVLGFCKECSLVQGCRLQLLQCPAELVGTGGGLAATAYAVEARDDVVDVLSAHQLADALKVATASAEEEDLLDDVVLVGRHVYEL